MNSLFVGIDVSSRSNVAYLMKPDGSKHSSFSVQNNPGGARILSSRIVSALDGMGLSRVTIGLESTSIYGDHLVYALREDGSLGRFTPKIHVLNLKQVRKFKEAYSDLPKNDFVDAFVIADNLRFGRSNREVYAPTWNGFSLGDSSRRFYYRISAGKLQSYFLFFGGVFFMRNPNGTGSVYKLQGKRRRPFTAVVTVGLVDGKYKRKTLGYYATRKEAMIALADYNHSPYDIDNNAITLKELYEKWIEYREGRKKPVASAFTSAFKHCDAFYEKRFVDIEAIHIQEMVDNASSPNIARRIKQTFNMLYKYALLTGICQANQTGAVDLPKMQKSTKHKPFNDEELAELGMHTDDMSAQFALIYCYTGLRPSELLNIKRDNVHIDKRYMIGGMKTEAGINRAIPIAEKILPLVQKWYEHGEEYLAPIKPRNHDAVWRMFQSSPIPCVRAHLPHDGRHTCETMLDNARVAKRTIQLIIGHAGRDIDDAVHTQDTGATHRSYKPDIIC